MISKVGTTKVSVSYEFSYAVNAKEPRRAGLISKVALLKLSVPCKMTNMQVMQRVSSARDRTSLHHNQQIFEYLNKVSESYNVRNRLSYICNAFHFG